MIKTVRFLKEELKDYLQPVNKIHRMIKDGEIYQIKKGLYETNRNVHPFAIARNICSPSYISFESALSYYGLIPERVYAITSATFKKRKNHEYENIFGRYYYSDVPSNIYFYGVIFVELEGGYSFHIASKEKALCDMLYKKEPVNNIKEMEELLLDDLRIDEDELKTFDMEDMKFFYENYRCKNVALLYKFLIRRLRHEHNFETDER